MEKNQTDIEKFISKAGCFNLQFRRDVRHERLNVPTYYHWRAQFVIIGNLNEEDLIRKIQNALNCGRIHYNNTATQLRYSVQDIDSLFNKIVPLFKKNQLSGKKKQDFELWAEAIGILRQNKGKPLNNWNKEDFLRLIEIHKTIQKYKAKKRQSFKWISVAESIPKTLKS